jgi:hypothetical protein
MSLISKYFTILYAGVIVIWVRALLMVKTLPQALSIMTAPSRRSVHRPAPLEDMVYYVDRWLTIFPYNAKGNCFPRSLALYWLAQRAGHSVQFCCGVRKMEGRLDGHAWLMSNGQPFHESTLHWKEFSVAYAFPFRTEAGSSRGTVPDATDSSAVVSPSRTV